MSAPTIRFATPTDLPALAGLHAEACAELAPLVPPGFGQTFLETPHDADEAQVMFAGKISQDDGFLLVAEMSGGEETYGAAAIPTDRRIAGFLVAHVEEYGDDLLSAPFLTIEDVVVARPRVLGVGAALIHAAEDIARQRGITQIDLQVWTANAPARALYEKLGYRVLEERRGNRLE